MQPSAKIIHYNQNEGKGIVNANGQTHSFNIAQWRGAEAPKLNSNVEIELSTEGIIALRPWISANGASGADSNNIAILIWIGCLFTGWLVPLIMYLVKKDDQFANETAKECLNHGITIVIGSFICFILSFVFIGILGYFVLGISHLVFTIIGAVNASKGQVYRIPATLRLIK